MFSLSSLFKKKPPLEEGDQQLSTDFTLSELVKSDLATRHGIDNTPDATVIASLRLVAQHILQPVRDHYGVSFSPNSGYRCLALNRLLKSPDDSQHIKGQAVDIEVPGVSNVELATWIEGHLPFDQLILEFYTRGKPRSGWVHCSYVPEKRRGDVMTFTQTGHLQGLMA